MTSISAERSGLLAVGMRHRRRNEWGARRSYTDARTVTEPATRVFIHITVTNPGNYGSDDAHARAVESIGISRFPNTGISYNRGVMHSGDRVYEFQPIGRRGAHTVNDHHRSTCNRWGSACPGNGRSLTAPSWNLNYNSRAYVICQNVQHTVTNGMVDQLAQAIAADALAGFVTTGAARNPHGHRCVSSKSCPGDRMWARMHDVADLVDSYIDNGLGGGGAVSYNAVWRTDGLMAAPDEWHDGSNPTWWPENIVERIARTVADLRDATYAKPAPFDDEAEWNLVGFRRWMYGHARSFRDVARDVADASGAVSFGDISSKLDTLVTNTAQDDARIQTIASLLQQHAEGVLDHDAVVSGVRSLLHDGTDQ